MSAPTITDEIRDGMAAQPEHARDAYALGVVRGAVTELGRLHPACGIPACQTCVVLATSRAAIDAAAGNWMAHAHPGPCHACDIAEDDQARRREDV